MAVVIVNVSLKPEILDPQGRAVLGAIGRIGLPGVVDVRQGKQFVLELDGLLFAVDDERHFGHYRPSMFFPASAAFTLRFIMISARCCVALLSTVVHWRMASRSSATR